jgi:hypothetical protein
VPYQEAGIESSEIRSDHHVVYRRGNLTAESMFEGGSLSRRARPPVERVKNDENVMVQFENRDPRVGLLLSGAV